MDNKQFIELIESFSRYLDDKLLMSRQLSQRDSNIMINRVSREVKNTIMVAEDKIGDMNLVPDKPRSLKLSQPGHLRSINIQFDPRAPTIVPVTLPKKKLSLIHI